MKAVIFSLSLLASPAAALQCGDHSNIVAVLKGKYSETLQSRGIDISGKMMEVYGSDETGTWTILVTQAGKPTCVVATGHEFEAIAEIMDEPT